MIADATNKVIYAGDGSTTEFDITFALPAGSTGSDVYLYVVDDEGNVTKLESNYSVDVNTMQATYPTVGGVSPLAPGVNALPIGWELVITREEPLSQTVPLTNQGVLDLPTLEKALDKLTMIAQQIQEQVNRCFKAPINVPYDPAVPVVIPGASVLAQYNGTLAYLISISDAKPNTPAFGIATDIGGGQLVWYPGYASTNGVQGSGWYAIAGGA